MPQRCLVYRLGMLPYAQAWGLQNRLATEIAASAHPPTLLLLEHPHTYTFGRRGQVENLLWDEAELARRGVSVHWVDRGGDVTYHGPGQLVGYPLLPLGVNKTLVTNDTTRLPQADYVGYVRKLEQTLITALARLGVMSGQLSGLTGVWVQPDHPSRLVQARPDQNHPPAKIASIGVKVDARGVTRHGFALNVNPDMTYWHGIIACGLVGYPVTSLAEIVQPTPSMEKIQDVIAAAFGDVFGYEISEAKPSALPDWPP